MTTTHLQRTLAPVVTDAELERLARRYAANPNLEAVAGDAERHTWARLAQTDGAELWLVSWPTGAQSGWHDHGGSRGAVAVAIGAVEIRTWHPDGVRTSRLDVGDVGSVGADEAHQVSGSGTGRTLTVHAYAPRVTRLVARDVPAGRELLSAGWSGGVR